MKNNKGITLIALIITIVVMLILVGISVQIVINSNLIGTAKNAGERTEIAYEEEKNAGENEIEEYKEIIEKGSSSKVIEKNKAINQNLDKNSVKEVVQTKTINETYEAPIPEGFTLSGLSSEQDITNGLVIYQIPEEATIDWTNQEIDMQKTYDQFVWIPVTNINDMYICQGKSGSNGECNITVENGIAVCKNENHSIDINNADGTTTNKNTLMAGYLYSDAEMTKRETSYQANDGRREPDIITGNATGDGTKCDGIVTDGVYTNLKIIGDILGDNTNYENLTTWKNALQYEYNQIVKSVYENKGFYVGRYETSNITTTDGNLIQVIKGKEPSTSINWYYMYAQTKDYAINKALTSSIGSAMIQEAAYNQVIKFVDPNYTWVTKTGKVGHSTIQGAGTKYYTGGTNYLERTDSMTEYIPYQDYAKNIYDLEGNVTIWTTAALNATATLQNGISYYVSFRESKGGNFNQDRAATNFLAADPGVTANTYTGTLLLIYIK